MTAGFLSFRSDATASNPETRDSGCGANAPSRNDDAKASSQKALRIDIDLELEIAFGLGTFRQPLTQILGQVEIAPRLHQQTETVTAFDDRKRRLRGPQHMDSLVNRRHGGEPARKPFRNGTIAGRNDQARQPS